MINLSEKERKIFTEIWKKKFGISRTEIVNITKFSKATVSRAVNKLMDVNMVKEGESIPTNSKGRPKCLLSINEKDNYIAGITINPSYVRIVIGDLAGTPLIIEKIDCNKEDILNIVVNIDKLLRRKYPNKYKKIISFSMVMPGKVKQEEMSVFGNFFSKKEKISFKHLKDRWNILLRIENDVNAFLISNILSKKIHYDNVFYIDSGFGASVVLNGLLIRGHNGGAGEFGHYQIDPEGTECWCGKKGCISSTLSPENLYKQFYEIIPKSYQDLKEFNFLKMISEMYDERFSSEFCEKYEEYLEKLACGILNITDLLGVNNVILNRNNYFFRNKSFEYIKKYIKSNNNSNSKICVSSIELTQKEIEVIPLAISIKNLIE